MTSDPLYHVHAFTSVFKVSHNTGRVVEPTWPPDLSTLYTYTYIRIILIHVMYRFVLYTSITTL